MDKEIEQLKSQIDELNELCSETLSPVAEPARREERLGILLLRLQDGDLESRYVHRLGKWLLADRKALQYYIDFMNLSALLHFHYHPDKASIPCLSAWS